MAEEVSGVDDKAFRTRLPVPRNQVNKSRACKSAFFTIFWIEKHKKCRIKRD